MEGHDLGHMSNCEKSLGWLVGPGPCGWGWGQPHSGPLRWMQQVGGKWGRRDKVKGKEYWAGKKINSLPPKECMFLVFVS